MKKRCVDAHVGLNQQCFQVFIGFFGDVAVSQCVLDLPKTDCRVRPTDLRDGFEQVRLPSSVIRPSCFADFSRKI